MRRVLKNIAPLLLLFMAVLACGPSNDGPNNPNNPNPPNNPVVSDGKLPEDRLERAILATVKIYIVDAQAKLFGTCSGTVVDPAGYIITDWHCVGLLNKQPPENGLQPGQFFHPQGWVVVGPTLSPSEAPKPTYIAQTMAGDPNRDIAVVKIIGLLNANDFDHPMPLPAGGLPLVVEPMGDSNSVKIGSSITAIGYPGIGGNLITVTHGSVAGFEAKYGNEIDSFKTDTTINHGNSGGLAINEAGEQIGIPAWGKVDQSGGSPINGILMINPAKPLLAQARSGTWRPPAPATAPQQAPQQQAPPVVPTAPTDPAQPQTSGVLMRGQIIDADTRRPVPQAFFVLLRPGVTFEQWQASGFSKEMVATYGQTTQDGLFQAAPAVAPGQTYVAVAAAQGYQPVVDSLSLPPNAPGLITIDPIPLQRR